MRPKGHAADVVCRTGAVLLTLTGAFFGLAAVLAGSERKFAAAATTAVLTALALAGAWWTARMPGRRAARKVAGKTGQGGTGTARRLGRGARTGRTAARRRRGRGLLKAADQVLGVVLALGGAGFAVTGLVLLFDAEFIASALLLGVAALALVRGWRLLVGRPWLSAAGGSRRRGGYGCGSGGGSCGGGSCGGGGGGGGGGCGGG